MLLSRIISSDLYIYITLRTIAEPEAISLSKKYRFSVELRWNITVIGFRLIVALWGQREAGYLQYRSGRSIIHDGENIQSFQWRSFRAVAHARIAFNICLCCITG